MPLIYDCPSVELDPGMTIYQVPYSDAETDPRDFAMFDNSDRDISWGTISDGSSNIIMVLEVNPEAAVQWTRPADWEYDPADPMRDLGDVHAGGFNAAFADASTEFISVNTPPADFKAWITRSGGEDHPRRY